MLIETQRSGHAIQVDHLDNEFVLDLIRESEVQDREAGRRKIRYAIVWAERHAVADAHEAAHWPETHRELSGGELRDVERRIGGEGTPMVGSASVVSFAAALGISSGSALQHLSDGLDLVYRLPMVHRGMESLDVAPWRARRIARMTNHLSLEAARYVDAQLAPVADSCGVTRIDRLIVEAVAHFDAEEQQKVEDEARAAWGVTLDHYAGLTWAGTSRMEIIGDTSTLTTFADLLTAGAHAALDPQLPAEEQPTLEHRKIAALRSIALGAGATSTTKAYVHLSLADLVDLPDGLVKLGSVEKLGPLTIARIKEWLGLADLTVVQPVLDLRRSDAVDQHDPPEWMRELVILRDGTCVFVNCDKDARDCDLDHIEAFVEMDDGGPPGQTRPDNLAPLCRGHHRAKTHFGWSYCRNADGSYSWTGPLGHRYTVDTRGVVIRHG